MTYDIHQRARANQVSFFFGQPSRGDGVSEVGKVLPSRSLAQPRSAAASGAPSAGTTKATGVSPQASDGTPASTVSLWANAAGWERRSAAVGM